MISEERGGGSGDEMYDGGPKSGRPDAVIECASQEFSLMRASDNR